MSLGMRPQLRMSCRTCDTHIIIIIIILDAMLDNAGSRVAIMTGHKLLTTYVIFSNMLSEPAYHYGVVGRLGSLPWTNHRHDHDRARSPNFLDYDHRHDRDPDPPVSLYDPYLYPDPCRVWNGLYLYPCLCLYLCLFLQSLYLSVSRNDLRDPYSCDHDRLCYGLSYPSNDLFRDLCLFHDDFCNPDYDDLYHGDQHHGAPNILAICCFHNQCGSHNRNCDFFFLAHSQVPMGRCYCCTCYLHVYSISEKENKIIILLHTVNYKNFIFVQNIPNKYKIIGRFPTRDTNVGQR
ncbi:hypothetical protein ALC60_07498 [Trachymyrmex zeteki]|uniref:Uncharacterized protein n=1 Tax=Mycetomoellerius zeteki TaxID=64791 RepID=A0A151WZP2_9HYME|nr:hypothetical protein ALC60_07498 [Trachymyrmex zeteki]